MYKREFDTLLNQNETLKSYLFFGEDEFLVEYYSNLILKKLSSNEDNTLKLYYQEYNFDIAKEFLERSSLFADKNILFIKIEKTPQTISKLVDICYKNNNSYLIISQLSDDKTSSKFFTSKKLAVFVRFFHLNFKEAIQFLEKKAKELKLNYSINTLEYLYNFHNFNINLCLNDLEKLSIIDKELSINLIDNYCFNIYPINIDLLIEKIINKENIIKDLEKLLNEGFNEISILSQIQRYFYDLYLIHIYMIEFNSIDFNKIFGYNPPRKIIERKIALARKLKLKQFKQIFDKLLTLELSLKNNFSENIFISYFNNLYN